MNKIILTSILITLLNINENKLQDGFYYGQKKKFGTYESVYAKFNKDTFYVQCIFYIKYDYFNIVKDTLLFDNSKQMFIGSSSKI